MDALSLLRALRSAGTELALDALDLWHDDGMQGVALPSGGWLCLCRDGENRCTDDCERCEDCGSRRPT